MSSPNLRTLTATKYLTPFREGGSLPGLVEADDDGLYVVKFYGAAQGPRALVACEGPPASHRRASTRFATPGGV